MVTEQSPPPANASATTDEASIASSANGGGANSPHSQRRSLPSPWASVVRGESDQISSPTTSPPPENGSVSDSSVIEGLGTQAQPESSDVNGDGNAGRPRRAAWNRPSNGVVEPVSVMGGVVSWPALSESTRPGQRSSSDTTPRPVSDGLVSSSQAPITSQQPQRPANTTTHANPTANNSVPTRPRSRNRGGGGGGPSHNTFSRPSPPGPPPFPVLEVPYGVVPPPMPDTSVRGPRAIGGVGGSQSHTSNEQHSSPRNNNSRRGGNYGPRPRGDGPGTFQNNNHGGRRDQDRRDVHIPPPTQYGPPPPMAYMPPPPPPPLPPGAAPFMAPTPLRVFPGPMGYGDMPPPLFYVPVPPESFRPMPIVTQLPPPMPSLTSMIVKQIDYYFSDDNLVKDNYLRSNMDDQGWVPISLIASFRRVEQMTKDVTVILESLRDSTVVEVQDEKVRRRDGWSKWLHSSVRLNSESSSQTPTSAAPENALATSLQEVSLGDDMVNANGNTSTDEAHTDMANGENTEEKKKPA